MKQPKTPTTHELANELLGRPDVPLAVYRQTVKEGEHFEAVSFEVHYGGDGDEPDKAVIVPGHLVKEFFSEGDHEGEGGVERKITRESVENLFDPGVLADCQRVADMNPEHEVAQKLVSEVFTSEVLRKASERAGLENDVEIHSGFLAYLTQAYLMGLLPSEKGGEQ